MSRSRSLVGIFRRPIADDEARESSAIVVGAAAFVLAFIVAAIVFWEKTVPISGPGSLGQFIAFAGAIVAFLTVIGGRVLASRSDNPMSVEGARLHWWDIFAIALAHAIVFLLGWLGMASVLELAFQGAVVFALSAAVLAAVSIALTAYVSFISSTTLTTMTLSLLLAVFLVVGAMASMLSSSDPLWWQKNLSSLGATDDVSAFAFNLTLIIAGVLLTTVAHYATASLPMDTPREKRGRGMLTGALTLIGVFLACVGIFPVDEFLGLHNFVATGMAVVYGVVVFSLHRWVPSMPRVFVILGYVYVAVVVVVAVFFFTGYYNLTAVELIAGVLIFSWVILFLRSTPSLTPTSAAEQVAKENA